MKLPSRRDGARVYVANPGDGTVSVIDTASNTVVNTIFIALSPLAVAITPDGTRLYATSNQSATITVIDTATNAVVTTIPVGRNPLGVVFSPDGARAYVEDATEVFNVIDTATNTVVTHGPQEIFIINMPLRRMVDSFT